MMHNKTITIFLLCSVAMIVVGLLVNIAVAGVSPSNSMIPQARQPEGGTLPGNAISITLTPGIDTSLIYSDAQGLLTQLVFPANATMQTTTITLIPELLTSPNHDFIFTGHAFQLIASRDGVMDKAFVFSASVTITIHYSDNDVQAISNEDQLAMYWWSGHNWQDAVNTCDPVSSYAREPADNRISVSVCYPGQLGLFATYRTYLPIISR